MSSSHANIPKNLITHETVNYPSPKFHSYTTPIQPLVFYPPSSILIKQPSGPNIPGYSPPSKLLS